MVESHRGKVLLLFDVDGTLTAPRLVITQEFKDLLKKLREQYTIGIVGGSDLPKQLEQLGENLFEEYDYVFSQNGLDAFQDGKPIGEQSISKHLGEKNVQRFINFALKELSQIELPVKRGTFIEFRKGMLNVCPVGRSCSQEERIQFNEYDKIHKVRETLVKKFSEEFKDLNLKFAIGGQISFDAFPEGWDKTYCLRFIEEQFKGNIHFFGDKTAEGGNDYEIYASDKTIGHSVKSFEETMEILKKDFLDK